MLKHPKIRYITVGGKKYDLSDELSIKDKDISTVLEEQPEKVAFWHRLRARAAQVMRKAEDDLKELEGDRFIAYRQHLRKDREKHGEFNDWYVRAYVNTDGMVQEKRKEVRVAKKKYDDLCAVCEALDNRKSSLMQLGAFLRMEQDATDGMKVRRRT